MSKKFRVLCALTHGFEELKTQCKALTHVEFIDNSIAQHETKKVDRIDAVISYASLYTESLHHTIIKSKPTWIHLVTAGVDPLIKYPPPINTMISSSGYVWSATVAEHAIALLFCLLRALKPSIERVKSGSWNRLNIVPQMRSIRYAKILVIGYGSIGRQITKQLQGFDVSITGLARTSRSEQGIKVFCMEHLDRQLAENDIVINCLPLNPRTKHVLSNSQFIKMKEDALFIDVSRGGTVDQAALLVGLRDRKPAAAGLDVFEVEPLPIHNELRKLDNVVLTPHVAGFGSQQVIDDMARSAYENLSDVLANIPPRDSISLNKICVE